MKVFFIAAMCVSFAHICFSQTKPTKGPWYSEDHAMSCVSDYYEFYNADEHYSDVKLRRISGTVFYVSLKYCSGPKEICYEPEYIGGTTFYFKPKEFFWHSKVLVLTITSKTKYTIKNKNGY